jgi:hypothetical protein
MRRISMILLAVLILGSAAVLAIAAAMALVEKHSGVGVPLCGQRCRAGGLVEHRKLVLARGRLLEALMARIVRTAYRPAGPPLSIERHAEGGGGEMANRIAQPYARAAAARRACLGLQRLVRVALAIAPSLECAAGRGAVALHRCPAWQRPSRPRR